MRAPFQVLVLPFRRRDDGFEFAALLRSDLGYWQGIAGGGEANESPEDAARREANEEAGIPPTLPYLRLQTTTSIPVRHFEERSTWPPGLFVIPEFSFGVDCKGIDMNISEEHARIFWGTFAEIDERLKWDSNRTALWELQERLHAE